MAIAQPVGVRLISALTRLSRFLVWTVPIVPPGAIVGFNVYRGKTPLFADAAIVSGPTPIAVTYWEDLQKERIEGFTYYYFVTSVDSLAAESIPVGPIHQEFDPFYAKPLKSSVPSIRRIADEMRRRHAKILKFDGEVAHYLVRKVVGPLAVDYDPLRRDAPYRGAPGPTNPYGTRFEAGYELLANTIIRFIPVSQKLVRDELGLTSSRTPTMWLVDFPVLQPRDILIRQNNERYRITNIRPQSIGGKVTRQVAELEYLEPSDVIYTYPIPLFVSPWAPVDPAPRLPSISPSTAPLTNPAKLPDKGAN